MPLLKYEPIPGTRSLKVIDDTGAEVGQVDQVGAALPHRYVVTAKSTGWSSAGSECPPRHPRSRGALGRLLTGSCLPDP